MSESGLACFANARPPRGLALDSLELAVAGNRNALPPKRDMRAALRPSTAPRYISPAFGGIQSTLEPLHAVALAGIGCASR